MLLLSQHPLNSIQFALSAGKTVGSLLAYAFAIGKRRDSNYFFKYPAKVCVAFESRFFGNLKDAQITVCQEFLRLFYADIVQVFCKSKAGVGLEGTGHIARANMNLLRNDRKGKIFAEMIIYVGDGLRDHSAGRVGRINGRGTELMLVFANEHQKVKKGCLKICFCVCACLLVFLKYIHKKCFYKRSLMKIELDHMYIIFEARNGAFCCAGGNIRRC